MDDELDIPEEMAFFLPKGSINISHEIGVRVPKAEAERRVQRHFAHADLGHHKISEDTFKLKVRSRNYPVFGSFSGRVLILEDVQEHVYRIEGLLQYRMSVLWFFAVLAFFFLLVYIVKPGFWSGACFEAIGSGIALFWTYKLGQGERDIVAERVEASLLQLSASFDNLR